MCCYCSEDLESKYENKLTREMSGPEYEIISRIMKTLVNKKITVPGSFIGWVHHLVWYSTFGLTSASSQVLETR